MADVFDFDEQNDAPILPPSQQSSSSAGNSSSGSRSSGTTSSTLSSNGVVSIRSILRRTKHQRMLEKKQQAVRETEDHSSVVRFSNPSTGTTTEQGSLFSSSQSSQSEDVRSSISSNQTVSSHEQQPSLSQSSTTSSSVRSNRSTKSQSVRYQSIINNKNNSGATSYKRKKKRKQPTAASSVCDIDSDDSDDNRQQEVVTKQPQEDSPSRRRVHIQRSSVGVVEPSNLLHDDECSFWIQTILSNKSTTHSKKAAAADLAQFAVDSTAAASRPLWQLLQHAHPSIQTALTILLYFLSRHCTATAASLSRHQQQQQQLTSSSHRVALLMRQYVLTNRNVVMGILGLIRNDALLLDMQGKLEATTTFVDDTQSMGTNSTGNSSTDPTRLGRERRKLKRQQQQHLTSIPEETTKSPSTPPTHKTEDIFAFSPASSVTSTASNRPLPALERAQLRVLETLPKTASIEVPSCRYSEHDAHNLALVALVRIMNGKMEGAEVSCLDGNSSSNDEDDDPILQTNQWLAQHEEVIPTLAEILAETLHVTTNSVSCRHCQEYLRQRVVACTNLMDQACLFHDENREEFSRVLMDPTMKKVLPMLLLSTSHDNDDQDQNWKYDIGQEVLRGLTSLTHENASASVSLELPLVVQVMETWMDFEQQQHQHDVLLYCLNILTNCVESATEHTLSILRDLKVAETPLWTWLTRWLVQQTASFREAILSVGASQRHLEADEREQLVMSGHGFVLLAYVIVRSSTRVEQEVVWKELVGSTPKEKLTFLKNSLTVLLNFYRYSVGELSVAVATPVKKLIEEIEEVIAAE